MTTHACTARERRAMNIIWNAAGEYGWQPDFLAWQKDKQPDFYLNSIIGFVHKWYDAALLKGFFAELNESALRDTFASILWLGLENAVFAKEVSCRPVLAALRAEHARAFFAAHTDLFLQELMVRNDLIHALQAARWHEVLGEGTKLLNPWERRLYAGLAFDAEMTTSDIITRTRQLLRDFFISRFTDHRASRRRVPLTLNASLMALLRKILPKEIPSPEDDLIQRTASAAKTAAAQTGPGGSTLLGSRKAAADFAYIQSCFGEPLYPAAEAAQLDQALCRGHHRRCRLYFTRGLHANATGTGAAARLSDAAAQQKKRNLAYYRQHEAEYHTSSLRLRDQIRNCLAIQQEAIPVRSQQGAFMPAAVWHALWLHDRRVFTATQEKEQPSFSVDLMLDASASRTSSQEIIAAQAFAIAESLRLCHIPLQISAFCSLRGYTVLRQLRRYQNSGPATDIFRYYAAGWNRDGLALRGLHHLMEKSPARQRLLIMLTDARPNDDCPLTDERTLALRHDYTEQAAIDDTAAEVLALRRDSIRVIGLISDALPGSEAAIKKIYGSSFVCIQRIDQLATAVGHLLQQEIRRL